MNDTIWKRHDIIPDAPPLKFELENFHVWIQYRNNEIWIAHKYAESETEGTEPETTDLNWSRWAYKSKRNKIDVFPVFPDLPVVISSEYPLHISPGARIRIISRIPAWMRIGFKDSEYVLRELPIIQLSKTWFGNPLEGELCYRATTKARRSLEGVTPKPYFVNCPIHITNKGKEDLNFENICLRVERLGIYSVGDELWAGETRVVYHGGDAKSDITMTGKLPQHLSKSELLSAARNPLQKSIAVRTFKKIFDDNFFTTR